jgi:hypothetical protein
MNDGAGIRRKGATHPGSQPCKSVGPWEGGYAKGRHAKTVRYTRDCCANERDGWRGRAHARHSPPLKSYLPAMFRTRRNESDGYKRPSHAEEHRGQRDGVLGEEEGKNGEKHAHDGDSQVVLKHPGSLLIAELRLSKLSYHSPLSVCNQGHCLLAILTNLLRGAWRKIAVSYEATLCHSSKEAIQTC